MSTASNPYWDDQETIVWPVVVEVQKKDGTKKKEKIPINVTFNLLDQPDLKAAPKYNPETATAEEINEVIEKRCEIAINNIVNFDKVPGLTYSPENLLKVLNKRPYFEAITNGFWEAQYGKS